MSSNYDMTPYDPSRESDFWSDGPVASPQPALAQVKHHAPKPVDPVERVRRLLRGRTTLAIVLALVGALLGASLGWNSQEVIYEAYGNVMIAPTVPDLTRREEPRPGYRQFMHSEVHRIESIPLAVEAIQQPVWKEQVTGRTSPRSFAASTDASYNDTDAYLHIRFRHADRKTAEAGATAVVLAYEQNFRERKKRAETQLWDSLEKKLAELEEEIFELETQIEVQGKQYGGISELKQKTQSLDASKANILRDIWTLERDLEYALSAQERALTDEPLTERELAVGDEILRDLLAERARLEDRRLAMVTGGLGLGHPSVESLSRQINSMTPAIETQAEQARQRYFGLMPRIDGEGMIPVTVHHLDWLQARLNSKHNERRHIEDQLIQVARDERSLRELEARLKNLTDNRELTTERLQYEQRNADFQEQMASIAPYTPPANSATVWRDKRKQMAAGGAILGFGIPIGLILALGMLDSRFRYSEDAAEAGERVTLLGILPNLPDRLSDPNQASIAAHCVHQIRTILQINHGSDESRAFAVTSGQRGDGKTSLALALGLSYAASGARTLLVDTDLQHGGLSSRLGVAGEEGIMDALSGGELMDFVCETDVTDLAILPIGRAAGHHAGAFSPAAVRHMLDQAKRHFDVIICDTGPILGSIEATPIAAAVDSVLLTVSRGQSRPLVTKALSHLENVGATLAGLVFNRAQASDFERSVSGMNLRSGLSRVAARSNGASRPVLSQN